MALRALMLRSKIDKKNTELSALREKDAEFDIREAELEQAIEEATTDEEQQAVQAEVEKFDEEKRAHEQEKSDLETEISGLEEELSGVEKEPPAHTQCTGSVIWAALKTHKPSHLSRSGRF